MSISTQVTSQKAVSLGQLGSVTVASSQQQDLRPRSSDGILQRITVDRGPATGDRTLISMLRHAGGIPRCIISRRIIAPDYRLCIHAANRAVVHVYTERISVQCMHMCAVM